MADARRIVFGSSTIAQETHTTEEGSTKAAILTQDSSGDKVSKKLGSTGNIAITSNQWGEGWTSMGGVEQYWSNLFILLPQMQFHKLLWLNLYMLKM